MLTPLNPRAFFSSKAEVVQRLTACCAEIQNYFLNVFSPIPGACRRDLRKDALKGLIMKPAFKSRGMRKGSASKERVLRALLKHLEQMQIAEEEGNLRVDFLARAERTT